jgi:hypothetical protein
LLSRGGRGEAEADTAVGEAAREGGGRERLRRRWRGGEEEARRRWRGGEEEDRRRLRRVGEEEGGGGAERKNSGRGGAYEEVGEAEEGRVVEVRWAFEFFRPEFFLFNPH